MAGFDFNTPNMMPFPGSTNPFSGALLAQLAANNPQLIAQVAAAHGIAPPTGQNPVNGMDFNQTPLGAFLTPSLSGDAGGAAPTPGVTPAGQAASNPWAAFQGFKGPQVPAPIMSGGVAGAQKAPDVSLGAVSGASNQLNTLIQSLMQSFQPQGAAVRPVGTLGSYLGR